MEFSRPESCSVSLLQGIFPTQGSKPGLLCCRQILYHLNHLGKPRNTGVGSLCLLQRIFLTQELNQGLLHCRQILYQQSYQGSPPKSSKSSRMTCLQLRFQSKHRSPRGDLLVHGARGHKCSPVRTPSRGGRPLQHPFQEQVMPQKC